MSRHTPGSFWGQEYGGLRCMRHTRGLADTRSSVRGQVDWAVRWDWDAVFLVRQSLCLSFSERGHFSAAQENHGHVDRRRHLNWCFCDGTTPLPISGGLKNDHSNLPMCMRRVFREPKGASSLLRFSDMGSVGLYFFDCPGEPTTFGSTGSGLPHPCVFLGRWGPMCKEHWNVLSVLRGCRDLGASWAENLHWRKNGLDPISERPCFAVSLIKWKLLARVLRRLIEAILFCMLEQETVRSSSLKRIQKWNLWFIFVYKLPPSLQWPQW